MKCATANTFGGHGRAVPRSSSSSTGPGWGLPLAVRALAAWCRGAADAWFVRCFATGQRGMSSACHCCRCSMMEAARTVGWLGVLMILNDWVVLIGSTFLALVIVALLVMALLGPPTLG